MQINNMKRDCNIARAVSLLSLLILLSRLLIVTRFASSGFWISLRAGLY